MSWSNLSVAIAQALSDLRAPVAAASGGTVTVTWSSTKADTEKVTLAVYSTNPSFNGPFAVVNNIDPQANKATLTLPKVVPGSGYSLALISMRDTSDVRAKSPSFAIGPVGHPVIASSATQTTARKASTSAKGSATATRSHAVSGSKTKSGSHAVSSSVRTHSGSPSTLLKSAPASARSTVVISSSGSVTAGSTPLSASSPTVQSPSLATATTPSTSFLLTGFPVPTTGTSSNASPSASPNPSAPNGASISASRFSSVRLGIVMFLGGLLACVVA